jgi:hypothetical protein
MADNNPAIPAKSAKKTKRDRKPKKDRKPRQAARVCRECNTALEGPPVIVHYTGTIDDSDDDCDHLSIPADHGADTTNLDVSTCRSSDCVDKAIMRLLNLHNPQEAAQHESTAFGMLSISTADYIRVTAPCRDCGRFLIARNRNFLGSACATLCNDCL